MREKIPYNPNPENFHQKNYRIEKISLNSGREILWLNELGKLSE